MQQTPITTYRPDIDGLRALAVLAVLAYHAFPAAAPGGFVGVDIFFVISGFVITRLLLPQLSHSQFSLLDFYARRIRRLFPALLVVLTCLLLLGPLVLFADEQKSLAKHIVAAAGFHTNLQLLREVSYFDTTAELKPLLHLWSLGVEMQFYLLFPFLLLLCRRHLQLGLFAAMAVTLGISLYTLNHSQTAAFYLPFGRFWELLAGALMAVISVPQEKQRPVAWVGLLLIAVSIVAINTQTKFPGWAVALPVVGAALLIAAPATGLARALSAKPLVAIGLISYPLYLWHWPLLVAVRHVEQAMFTESMPALRAGAIAASFILAAATYWLLERPARKMPARKAAVIFLILIALIAAVASSLRDYSLHHSPAVAAAADWQDFSTVSEKILYEGHAFYKYGQSENITMLLGDSNAEQYFPRLQKTIDGNQNSNSLIMATLGGCPPMPHVIAATVPKCTGFVDAAGRYAKQTPAIKHVVIAADWGRYFSGTTAYQFALSGRIFSCGHVREAVYQDLGALIERLSAAGKKVTLVLPMPTGLQFDPKIIARHQWLQNSWLHTQAGSQSGPTATEQFIDARLQMLADGLAIKTINPKAYLCADAHCPYADSNSNYIYKDATHLRASWVRNNANYIDAILTPAP